MAAATLMVADTAYPHVRCMAVWYDDGNLVVQAEQTQFKVHRGVLAAKSTVFRDMLAFPQPAGADTLDGCPVVLLQDSASDVEHAFRAMYGERSYFLRHVLMGLPELSGLLQIGSKYDIQELREEAVDRLRGIFPDTLDAYLGSKADAPETALKQRRQLPLFCATNLAAAHGVDVALPALYLMCAQYSNADIVRGTPSDGLLSPAIQAAVLVGKEKVRDVQHKTLCDWCNTADHDPCLLGVAYSEFSMYMSLPTSDLNWGGNDVYTGMICTICEAYMEAFFTAGRIKFWKDLPSHFDLPSWEELRRAAAEDL